MKKERFTMELGKESDITYSERQKKNKAAVGKEVWYYLGSVGQIGYAIALPIAGGALLGAYIDRRWSTYPNATLSLLLIGAIISIAGFIKTVQDIMNRKN